MKFIWPILFLISGCSVTFVKNPDVAKVEAQETFACTFHEDIQWELDHNVSPDKLIEALDICKHPKFKRGEVLLEKDNKNCTFQIYYADVMYPSKMRSAEKLEPLYTGKEDCGGLIDTIHSNVESNLLIRGKRIHKK